MRAVLGEIHGRSLWQTLGVYVGVSWVVLQVVQTLTEGLGLPDWVVPFAVILLLLGLPIVLVTAFVQGGARGAAAARADADPPPEPLEPAEPADAPAPEDGRGSATARARLFSWRNALLGGAAAFALLGVLTAAWMIMRSLGIGPAGTLVAKGILEERDQLVLADFVNRTDDPDLATSVTEALRVDLGQSMTFRLAEPRQIASARERMQLADDAALDEATARELARREGMKAVVGGEISSVGEGYLLLGRVVSAGGEVLTNARVTADGPSDLLPAIDELSKDLRERIGESLRQIRAEPPLERVTTSNLEALRLYSRAVRSLDYAEYDLGIPLLEQAIALDTAFAAAFRQLGVALGNMGEQRARRTEMITRAFAHRDRLTPRERNLAIATYHTTVTDDFARARAAYRAMLEVDSLDYAALNNLAILVGRERGSMDEAIRLYALAARSQPETTLPVTNIVWPLVTERRIDEARGWIDTLENRDPDNAGIPEYRAHLAWVSGDPAETEAQALSMLELHGGVPYLRGLAHELLADLAGAQGRLAEAERRFREAAEVQAARGLPGDYVDAALEMGWVDLEVRSDPDRAIARLDAALARYPWESIAPLDRPYFTVADYLSVAGRPDRALALIAEYETTMPAEEVRGAANALELSRAEIAIAEGRYQEAIDRLRRLDERWGCLLCALPSLAMAYDAAGDVEAAIETYERFLETDWLDRIQWDVSLLGPTYERLAELAARTGDEARVRRYSEALIDLWEDADPELQPRVDAARRRLADLEARE